MKDLALCQGQPGLWGGGGDDGGVEGDGDSDVGDGGVDGIDDGDDEGGGEFLFSVRHGT